MSVRTKTWTSALFFLAATCMGGPGRQAEGQLRWAYPPKRAAIRVRLVAIAASLPRSTFFKSAEVFVAETEIGREEWSPIKLIFTFLPYEPRLSESGFDYSMVHEVSASRDRDCDETFAHLKARDMPKGQEPLIYSRNVPREDLERKPSPLPCYETSAYEYIKSSFEPIGTPAKQPVLQERPKSK